MAMPARVRSGQSDFAMPRTACATTATAATLRPFSRPDAASPAHSLTPQAKTTSATADGRVKPAHAAKAPGHPARPSPRSMPTWLLAGPGSSWQRATRSE